MDVAAVTGCADLNGDESPNGFVPEAEPALFGSPMTLIPMLGKALGIVTQSALGAPEANLELMWGVIRAVAAEDGSLGGIDALENAITAMRGRRERAERKHAEGEDGSVRDLEEDQEK